MHPLKYCTDCHEEALGEHEPSTQSYFDASSVFAGLDYIVERIIRIELPIGSEMYRAQLFEHHGQYYSYASSHISIYCQLLHPTLPARLVVFKFRILPLPYSTSTYFVRHMTDEELQAAVRRTALLRSYCRSFNQLPNPSNYTVRTNKVVFGQSGGYNWWVEDYIPTFTKFWSDTGPHLHRLVGTSSAVLSLLQEFIFTTSEHRHTVIDLQGGFCDNEYVLRRLIHIYPQSGWSAGSIHGCAFY